MRKAVQASEKDDISEDGVFRFRVTGSDKTFSIPVEDYEKSRKEIVKFPGEESIFLFRGRVFMSREEAKEEYLKRFGKEPDADQGE